MSNEQILKQAISKAVENGYSFNGSKDVGVLYGAFGADYKYEALIFSHSFAKAFFGVEWENSLMSMVRREEPLKYIEKFL